jgi:hypothetical protein
LRVKDFRFIVIIASSSFILQQSDPIDRFMSIIPQMKSVGHWIFGPERKLPTGERRALKITLEGGFESNWGGGISAIG